MAVKAGRFDIGDPVRLLYPVGKNEAMVDNPEAMAGATLPVNTPGRVDSNNGVTIRARFLDLDSYSTVFVNFGLRDWYRIIHCQEHNVAR